MMYLNRKLSEDIFDFYAAKNFTVYNLIRWLDSQLLLHPKLKAFFRTISPKHFFNGDWNTGDSCKNTIPLIQGSEVLQDESTDEVIEAAIKDTRVKILDITVLFNFRDDGHISNYIIRPSKKISDCLHWCLPGIPDTWNEILIAQL